jgi:hypothetical protein
MTYVSHESGDAFTAERIFRIGFISLFHVQDAVIQVRSVPTADSVIGHLQHTNN